MLAAIEGLETAAPGLEPYVVPLAVLVLFGLFLLQSRGTASVGRLFGPVMLAWFATLGLLGLAQIVQSPSVLAALDPRYAVGLFGHDGWQAFVALGAIVLAITGAEALYADMGHFGRTPIRLAWFGLVLPALVLNYFGQGALLLREPEALQHPFYHLAPGWALLPLIGLATLATIIASQAVISGVFSLTGQAIQLGHLSRMTVRHTSAAAIGQIYIPRVNWLLMAGVLALVVGFGSSGNLAAAYGISVTGAMAIDAVLAGLVAAWLWGWGLARRAGLRRLLPARLRLPGRERAQDPFRRLAAAGDRGRLRRHGGHLAPRPPRGARPALRPWPHGRELPRPARPAADPGARHGGVPDRQRRGRADGAAAQHPAQPGAAPEGGAADRRAREDVPYVAAAQRLEVEKLGKGFYRVAVSYGFMDEPDIPRALERCRAHALPVDLAATSYFVARETLIPSPRPELNPLEERLFMLLTASNLSATTYFQIPPDQVVELGLQLEI